MRKRRLAHILLCAIMAHQAFSQVDISLDLSEKSEGIVKVEFDMEQGDLEITNMSIFIDETYTTEFPSQKVTSFSGRIPFWKFNRRKSLHLFGYDLRQPKQLSRRDLWTPGEVYTIGVMVEYNNADFDTAFTHLLPFEIIRKDEIISGPVSQSIPLEEKGEHLPKSSDLFINEADELLIPAKDNDQAKKVKIQRISEYEEFILLELTGGVLVKYDKPVKRPEFLGNIWFVFYFMATFIIALSILTLLYFYFAFRTRRFVKELDADTLDDKIRKIKKLLSRKNSVIIFFFLAHNSKFQVDEHSVFRTQLKRTYKKYQLYQSKSINNSLLAFLTTYKSELEQVKYRHINLVKIKNSNHVIVNQDVKGNSATDTKPDSQ